MAVEQMENSQSISAADLAQLIRALREMRQWSQDTLSALSKLSIRTIQRVENGKPSSEDTRRALALSFELENVDVFNQPFNLPNPEHVQAELERMKREHVPLNAQPIRTGRELVRLFENASMDSWTSSDVSLEGAAAESYAGLIDYLRDYRDAAPDMSETQKLQVFSDIQEYLDVLGKAGFSVNYARRDTKLVGNDWPDKTPWAVSIVYMVVSSKGQEPKVLLVPRQVNLA